MLIFIILLSFLNSKELKFNFIDWNYDSKIEVDSLNIRNIGLGIDTTLINPKILDLEDLLIINDVKQDIIKDFSINYSQNTLIINSKEIIQSIKIVDLLGKTILELTPNSTQFSKNITLQENLTFLILNINNKTFIQKLYNFDNKIYKSPSVILNDQETWYFTPYKENYRDTTYTFQNYQLKDTLDIDLKRDRYLVSISSNNVMIKNNYYKFALNPANNQKDEINKDTFYERTFFLSLVLFETKYSSFDVYSVCPNEIPFYYGNGFFKVNRDDDRNTYDNTYIELNNNNLSNFYHFTSTNDTEYETDCSYGVFRYSLSGSIGLDSLTSNTFNNEIEGSISFEYKMRRNSGHYSYTEIKENIYSIKGSTTTLTIQKLD